MRIVSIAACLFLIAAGRASAQTSDDRGGFAVREVSVSTGYGTVQLPPVTLGGYLPNESAQAGAVANASAAIDWRHAGRRTTYAFDLFGTYTAHERYSQLNAPAANVTFGVTRAIGNRWRLAAGVNGALVTSDQVATQPTQTRRLVDDAGSFDDLAGTVALSRSASPNLSTAALFLPINQTLDTADQGGNRGVISSVSASATYAQSTRFSTHVDASYTTVRQSFSNRASSIQASSIQGAANPDIARLLSLNSTAEFAGLGIRYDKSARSQFTTDVAWSQTSGLATDEVVSTTLGYGWTGRKWFMRTTAGVAVRPLDTNPDKLPVIIYSGALGYKFQAQTLLVQYTQAPHDELGDGGRNVVTGFTGDMRSVTASWAWVPQRSRWTAHSDFSLIRRPGNFSYTFAWLATSGIGRQFGSNVRVMGELLFDRHGSRGFEGFALTRQEARLTFIWMLPRRPAGSAQ